MGKKLYVGGLSYSTTEDALAGYFQQVGAVESARIVTDRDTGRSKGFGFVEMGTPEEAAAAVSKFNGVSFDGRVLTVNEARPKPPRENRRSDYGERW